MTTLSTSDRSVRPPPLPADARSLQQPFGVGFTVKRWLRDAKERRGGWGGPGGGHATTKLLFQQLYGKQQSSGPPLIAHQVAVCE